MLQFWDLNMAVAHTHAVFWFTVFFYGLLGKPMVLLCRQAVLARLFVSSDCRLMCCGSFVMDSRNGNETCMYLK